MAKLTIKIESDKLDIFTREITAERICCKHGFSVDDKLSGKENWHSVMSEKQLLKRIKSIITNM